MGSREEAKPSHDAYMRGRVGTRKDVGTVGRTQCRLGHGAQQRRGPSRRTDVLYGALLILYV
jgi:hypothetical protein